MAGGDPEAFEPTLDMPRSADERAITHRYSDPLDVVWLGAARAIGLRVERSAQVFAATDGRGTLTIGAPETLDPDDCLAQMVFHELCHSLVQGPESFDLPDWGLENISDEHLMREHACLRAQAVLARRHGLGLVFAPTTDHRAFYDALGPDPLAGDHPSIPLARAALARYQRDPWGPHLEAALEASATIVEVTSRFARPNALVSRLEPKTPSHPSGLKAHPEAPGTCGECAWNRDPCLQSGVRVDRAWAACERFEPAIECDDCGACCGRAYGLLELEADEPFVARHPDLVTRADGRLSLRRDDGRCPPLEGDGSSEAPYRCALYEDRPRTCRTFERGGEHCLAARRRVGRSL